MKFKFLLIGFVFLLLPMISAYNVELTLNSNLADFNTYSYECSNSGCSTITFYEFINTGTKINTYSLIGSGNDYYTEYDYKTCYAPHIYTNHVWDPYSSEENFAINFNKKEACKGIINQGSLSETNINLGESVLISSNVDSAFDYPDGVPTTTVIPSLLSDEYSSKTKVKIYANNILIKSSEEEILLGTDKDFEFEWTPDAVGTYEIIAKSEITDCACSSQNTQEFLIGILTVNEEEQIECTQNSDCGTNRFIGNVFCSSNDIFQNFITFTCNNPGTTESYCSDSTVPKFKEDCGDESFSEDYCRNNDVVRNHIIPSCAVGKCVSTNSEEIVEVCNYDCVNGECVDEPEPVCGNNVLELGEECDDGNLINNDGCSSLCEIEEIECCDDEDCPNDVALPPTCKNNDVFGNYIDYFCLNNECQSEVKDFFVQDCGNDYCDNFGDNYCKGDDVYHSRTCYNKGCLNGACYNEDYEDEKLVEECAYDCVNGECVDEPEPVCGNNVLELGEECDDGNLINNDGCSSLCEIEEIVCYTNSDCGTPHCNNPLNFCYNNDIFQEYIFFTCNNPGTTESYCSNYTAPYLILDCGEDSCDNFEDNYCKNNDVYSSRTCYQRGCRTDSCFIDSFNEEQLIMNCEYDCSNGSCIDQPIEAPIINLISPLNNTNTTNIPINFTYNVISDSLISNCSLIIDSSTRLTSSLISISEINSFEYSPSIGTHSWLVSCTNAFDMTDVSETRVLTLTQSGECTSDSQCGSDFYSDKYCSSGEVYKDYHDFSCVIGECKENITKELVEECDYGCSDGECKDDDEDDEEGSWCIETNNCELTYDDGIEFDDSITLKSNNLNQTLGSIMLGSSVSETEPNSYFWVIIIAIAIIIVLILLFFLLI